MRQKEEKGIVTFPTTTAALAMEKAAKELDLPGRLIPVPVSITASCGLAWMVDVPELEWIQAALTEYELQFSAVQVVLI